MRTLRTASTHSAGRDRAGLGRSGTAHASKGAPSRWIAGAVLLGVLLATPATQSAQAQHKVRDYPHIEAQNEAWRRTRRLRTATRALAAALLTAYDTIGALTGRDMNPVIDQLAADLESAGGLAISSGTMSSDMYALYGDVQSAAGTIQGRATEYLDRLDAVLGTSQGALLALQEHASAMQETRLRMALDMTGLEDSGISETEAQQLNASIRVLEAQELQLVRHAVLLQINMEAVRLAQQVQAQQGEALDVAEDVMNTLTNVLATPLPPAPTAPFVED